MKVETYIGEKRVLSSGTMLVPKEEQPSMRVDTETGLQFTVNFSFLYDKDNTGIEVKFEQDNLLTLVVHGEPNQLGTAPSRLVDIGTINGKRMWMYYIAYKMFDGQFLKIEYAFYEG